MKVDMPIELFLEKIESRFLVFPLSRHAARLAAELSPTFPGDPFDRIIAGTALAENLPLITVDQNIRVSRVVKTIW